MRVNETEKENTKKKIFDLLSKFKNDSFNLSRVARSIEKAPPTVLKYALELKKEGKIEIIDLKSMKLLRLRS